MRLGQTLVCVVCAVRFRAAPGAEAPARCPACGGTRVLDLARPQGREAAWAAWHGKPPVLAPLPPPGAIDPAIGRRAFVGRVRALAAVRSPIRRAPCVLFTLAGHAPGSVIADAGGASFELVARGGARAVVELGDATVLGGGRPRVFEGDAPIDFLEERGAYLTGGLARVTERLVCEGDELAVEGPAEERALAGAYRGGGWELVFRDLPMSPLVISAASSPA